MFQRFIAGNHVTREIENLTYRNSRIIVLKCEQSSATPYELVIDLVRQPIRFKTSQLAIAHAVDVVNSSREVFDESIAVMI